MQELKEFNAKIGLEGFNATESRPYATGKNALEEGKEVIFIDSGELGKWGDKQWPMVTTDTGIKCNAPYIAGCMLPSDGIVLNENMDEKFHCMHTPRSAKDAEIPFDYVQNNLTKDGTFPKMRAVRTLPVAVAKKNISNDEKKKLYQEFFGTPLEKLDVEYVPSLRKSNWDSNGGIYSIKSTIVELV